MFLPEDSDPPYPDRNDPDILSIIYSKAEFRECVSGRNPYSDKRVSKDFFNTQVFIQRYLTAYGSCLLFHEQGSGKSRSFEAFRRYMTKYRPQHVKNYYVIAQETLLNEYKRQIKESMSLELDTKNDLSEYGYIFMTIDAFAADLNLREDIEIKNDFIDCAFFFDEIHKNLRITEGVTDSVAPTDKSRGKHYTQVLRLTTFSPDSYYIFATGTPIVNQESELYYHVNLMPGLRKIKTKLFVNLAGYMSSRFKYVSEDSLGKVLNGRVLYAKTPYSGAIEVPPPKLADTREVEYDKTSDRYLTKYPMSSFQSDVFMFNYNPNSFNDDVAYMSSLDSSVFVYPSDAYMEAVIKQGIDYAEKQRKTNPSKFFGYKDGEQGYKNCITSSIVGGRKKYLPTALFRSYLNFPGTIKHSGAKIYDIIKTAQTAKGVVYVSGTRKHINVLLTVILSLKEYSKYDPDEPHRKSYATLTRQNKLRYSEILSVTGTRGNVNGEKLKIILAMPVASVGINIGNVSDIFILNPMFTPDDIDQRRDRAFRPNSYLHHKQFPVKVNVYYCCSYTVDEKGLETSVDIAAYQHINDKILRNKPVIDYIKSKSVDRILNVARNEETITQDGMKLMVHSDNTLHDTYITDRPIDYSTYNAYYAMEYVQECSKEIFKILRNYPIIPFELLKTMLSSFAEQTIILAVKNLNSSAESSYNNRFGFPIYIKYSGDYLYETRYVRLQTDPMMSYYNSCLHFTNTKLLETSLQEVMTRENIPEYKDMTDILRLEVPHKVFLLEQSYIGTITDEKLAIRKLFRNLTLTNGDTVVHQLNNLYSGASSRKPVTMLMDANSNLRILARRKITKGPAYWRDCNSEEITHYSNYFQNKHKQALAAYEETGKAIYKGKKPSKYIGIYGTITDVRETNTPRHVHLLVAGDKDFSRGAEITTLDKTKLGAILKSIGLTGLGTTKGAQLEAANRLWKFLLDKKLVYNFFT